MNEHKRIERLMLFVELGRQLNFSRAAEVLGISRSYLSEQIKKLESELQAPLVIRTTRSVRLTPEGERAYQQGLSIRSAVLDLERNLNSEHNEISGLLRLTAPKMFAESILMGLCRAFKQRHPEITFEINSSYQSFNLNQTDIDLAFRATQSPPEDMVAYRLFDYQHWLVASPKYLQSFGAVKRIEDLENHQCLTTLHQRTWPLKTTEVEVSGWMASNDNRMLREFALKDEGIVRIASYFVENDVKNGVLEQVLAEETSDAFNSLYMVYPQLIYPSAKLKAFVEFVKLNVNTRQ
ncbi:LysR family transcriptional regulator [Vibrio breoganii]|uniref:LysR family transcriptional regulator n=1 Tax=Vibrio breoganii TaxID=553239 RepID=UPI000C85CE73|nr:LysR family transcriptional regulator [Vibrio breoganii]PMM25288.1 LysR family transcriptional regulator [Vibrio breoganii]